VRSPRTRYVWTQCYIAVVVTLLVVIEIIDAIARA
jgi:hypothetical protein